MSVQRDSERRDGEKPITGSSIFVVVPTYNEAGNLPNLVAALFELPLEHLQIVVVDDNSPDGTGDIAEGLASRYDGRLRVLHRSGKQGLGSAYRAGFRYALDAGADYVVQMDADFSHSPAYISGFLAQMGTHDVVVGSRYVDGGRLDPDWSWWRYRLSWWANSVWVRLFLNLKVKDATGGFKCWSRSALSAVLAYPVRSGGYVFQVEMAYLTEKLGLRVLELPIFFEDRAVGQSKMSGAVKLEAMWRTLFLPWQYRRVKPVRRTPEMSIVRGSFVDRQAPGRTMVPTESEMGQSGG
jgi:dolichol-phosphate mannosyltransferase